MSPRLPLALLALLALLAQAAPAQPNTDAKAQIKRAVLNQTVLRPGDKAMLAVELEINEGFHAQSHTPKGEFAIKFDIKLDPNDAVTFGEPKFPPGHDEVYKELGPLNVYTGKVIVRVPVEVKSDAKPGEIKLTGKLTYQICDDKVCYPPERPGLEIKSSIVPAGTEVKPNEPELFKEAEKQGESAPSEPNSAAATPPAPTQTIFGRELASNAYLLAFFGAFVVGMVFNVMPCVLPVVPLKIMGFAQAAEHSRAKSFAFGAVFSAGLVASFGVLALLIVVLRVIDWGGLFTKWWFIIPMVIILLLMAMSMFGAFTVSVPTALYNVAPRHDTYVGNFLFGVLTAALSTPCTFGMFVGLLAWALTQPAIIGVTLIMTVGFGMAFPYLVLSAFPDVARKFPRGGAWGEVVKQFMGFLLIATAVYFAGPILGRLGGFDTVWWIVFAALAAGALFLLVRGLQVSKTSVGRVAAVAAAIVLVPSIYFVRELTAKPFEWTAFTPEALEKARAEGKIVLVEFTAIWCGNCHWVETFVIKSPEIVKAVRENNVVMLKADVTEDDAAGWPLLRKFSAAGAIPVTVVYPPCADQPLQLTGIYKIADLKRALDDASRESLARS